MTDRYTPDELARLSDTDLVRRELDARNRRTLGVMLLLFAGLSLGFLIVEAFYGVVPKSVAQAIVANILINLVSFVAVRSTRRHVTAWVLSFCVLQLLVIVNLPHHWWITWFVALLYARFRLTAIQTAALYTFMAVATGIAASVDPIGSTSAHFSGAQATLMVVATCIVIIAFAAALQIVTTRRVRGEILDEWREPLRNAREQVRMRDELHYARQMQLAMLPEGPPAMDWLDVAAVSIPAAEVGGDYYDFFRDGDRLAIVACDVAGHGMQSGLVLAAMRGGLIATLGRSLTTPANVLDQLHDLVARTSRQRMLAAALVVLFDKARRRATIASAAHPPAILRRGGNAEVLEAFAPPLGVRLPFTSGVREIDLQPGDVLVIHSDGVYESRNAAGEEYGLERLRQFIAAQPAELPAAGLRDAIVRDVERFRGRPQDDDVTVLVARVTIGAAWN